ncbi:MAG: adenylate/guanylate cyclase domain-containing protein [Betaproteobacteria bacterium]|nr:adenylate/guanylate cyclase domain-containing protein [Betaproteobacteria bacterium]
MRSRLRLASALVMLAFVLCHLSAHATLIISPDFAESVLAAVMRPWRSDAGTVLLLTAFFVHYGNALWSLYARRSLRLMRWEWTQLLLGLCIPLLLCMHLSSTRIAEVASDVDTSYPYVLVRHWVLAPPLAALQIALVCTVWAHACIGIHFWLRTKLWYAAWRPALTMVALMLPTLALAGYVAAGNHFIREAERDPEFAGRTFEEAKSPPEVIAASARFAGRIALVHLGLVGFVLVARRVRRWLHERREPPILTHASGQRVPIVDGATVLELLRDHGIPHASVCGGRARCTTCRVHVSRGLESLPPAGPLEAQALARIGATHGIRLACQVRPTAELSVTPLLAADATAADGYVRGGLEGSERLVTVMFVDLRGSTRLGEAKLPYDVLFILNRFFLEMNRAIQATRGHYSQFTGDGLMALYGLEADDPAVGPADALRGAREMLMRVEQLNRELRHELPHPLQIGIGIHYSEAIVGMMGPPRSMIVTAIGDTVNTAARLESLTKDYNCTIVISRRAAEVAGLDLAGRSFHEAAVKGKTQSVQFLALQEVPAAA